MAIFQKVLAKIIITGLLLGSMGFLVLSCASQPNARQDTSRMFEDPNQFRDIVANIRTGQEAKKPPYPESNAISLFLDLGLLEYYAGNHTISSQYLLEAERLIEDAYTKSVTENIASYIGNDNAKNYAGEDFEDIYLSVFNSLNFYKQGNLEGALVEVRKLTLPNGKLDMLNRKYEESNKTAGDWVMAQLGTLGFAMNDSLPQGDPVMFNNSALAHYLSGLFYLEQGNLDSARISFDSVHEAYAGNPKVYTTSVPASVNEARDVPEGKARLNVIAFSGLSPIKEEGKFTQTWLFMQNIALQYPIFKLPQFVDRGTPGSNDVVEVSVNGETFRLELLEDMGAVVKETYNAKFANTFFKTWIRVMLKYAAADIAATKAGERVGGAMLANAGALAAKKALDASEGADIRMGQFLPNKAFIGGINLDPGSYTVTVQFASGTRYEYDVEVNEGSLNLIDTFCLKTSVGPPTTVARTAASQSDGQSTAVAVSIVAQAPATSAPISNKRYEVVNKSMNWTKAQAEAESRGGYLAVITNAQEQETIENLMRISGNRNGYWLGGYCERDRVWKWVNNEPMNYTNWAPGEPNNYDGQQNKMVIILRPFNQMKFGQWDDERNNAMDFGYIIEWD